MASSRNIVTHGARHKSNASYAWRTSATEPFDETSPLDWIAIAKGQKWSSEINGPLAEEVVPSSGIHKKMYWFWEYVATFVWLMLWVCRFFYFFSSFQDRHPVIRNFALGLCNMQWCSVVFRLHYYPVCGAQCSVLSANGRACLGLPQAQHGRFPS